MEESNSTGPEATKSIEKSHGNLNYATREVLLAPGFWLLFSKTAAHSRFELGDPSANEQTWAAFQKANTF
jgi:hypothetical protein